jgi:hypothetical protein
LPEGSIQELKELPFVVMVEVVKTIRKLKEED